MGKTNIEYVDMTINPFVGCSKCSIGCESCYAERFAYRLSKNPITADKYAGVVDDKGKWTGKISQLDLSCFDKLPKKPSRVFVGSMTDLFHGNVPCNWLTDIFAAMDKYPQHTFLLLTKRPKNFYQVIPLPNVWFGVTVCNQQEADEKIPQLLDFPTAKRFISVEPMLSEIDIRKYLQGDNKLSWVICGGETGSNARPMHEAWVKSLRDQCLETETPYFFKSWGEWLPYGQRKSVTEYIEWEKKLDSFDKRIVENALDKNDVIVRIGKKKSSNLIDGVEYRQFPEV